MDAVEKNMTPKERRAHERAMSRRDKQYTDADIYAMLVDHIGGKRAADILRTPKDQLGVPSHD